MQTRGVTGTTFLAFVLLLQACAGGARYGNSEVPMMPPTEAASAPEPPTLGDGYGYDAEPAPAQYGSSPPPAKKASDFSGTKNLATLPTDPPQDAGSGDGNKEKRPAPLLIYSANLVLSVFEAKTQIGTIESLAKEKQGYLVNRGDDAITIRVPAESFEATLAAIAKCGDEIHRDIRVSDVTAEFRDIEIRLQNARAVRARLEELLAKAQNVEDALKVERELERISGEIESMSGKLKLFRELISFSTITVTFSTKPVDRVENQVQLPFPWLNELGLTNLLRL